MYYLRLKIVLTFVCRKLSESSYKTLTAFHHEKKGWGVKTLTPLSQGNFYLN